MAKHRRGRRRGGGFNAPSVQNNRFALAPSADVPRSSIRSQSSHKTAFDADYLIPVYVDEVLPGDHHRVSMTAFCRMSTPVFPVMDNMYLDSFFFFVPERLLWDNFERMMGAQDDPADAIDYIFPKVNMPTAGYTVGSVYDYFGLPTVGQVASGESYGGFRAGPLRAYNRIWNEWFRDQNLQDSVTMNTGDSNDSSNVYVLLRRGKRHDYFTSCLPWPQKGDAVTLALGSEAPISGLGVFAADPDTVDAVVWDATGNFTYPLSKVAGTVAGTADVAVRLHPGTDQPDVYADLTEATAQTINTIRTAFQMQRLLERNARGGTRYTELVYSHFRVRSPDARLQRPEYLGGGSVPIQINPVAQQSATSITGGATPLGNLAGVGTGVAQGHGFSYSATEHGWIIGLVNVRADLTYQQGVHRMWNRSTKYDLFWPVFSHLGEQAVTRKEIYFRNLAAEDNLVFGYQERWAEYRYMPSRVSSLFRSTAAGTIDPWHLAERFTSAPTLSATFIQSTTPMSRVLAVGAGANGKQFIFDSFFDRVCTRAMPIYSVPGLVDHF